MCIHTRAPGFSCSAISASPDRGTDISREVCRTVARAIEECRGPGVVVFAGDVFDLRDGTDVDVGAARAPAARVGARGRSSPATTTG